MDKQCDAGKVGAAFAEKRIHIGQAGEVERRIYGYRQQPAGDAGNLEKV